MYLKMFFFHLTSELLATLTTTSTINNIVYNNNNNNNNKIHIVITSMDHLLMFYGNSYSKLTYIRKYIYNVIIIFTCVNTNAMYPWLLCAHEKWNANHLGTSIS